MSESVYERSRYGLSYTYTSQLLCQVTSLGLLIQLDILTSCHPGDVYVGKVK